MAFGKIGLHVLRNGVKPADLATAPCVCLVDCSAEYIHQVRAANPAAWIVVRWVYQGDQNAALREPEKAADTWWAERKGEILATMGPRTVYQGLNEIGSGVSDLYVRYEARRAGHLWGVGAGLGLGAWSVGEPDYHVWPAFWRVLQGMGAGDAILLHEYWADPSDLDKRWYTARWTDERVWPMVRGHNIIVTECGRDAIWENGRKRGQPGWRKTITADGFLMEVWRYEALLKMTPDVIGGCLFTGGVLGEWRDFDANQLWPRIVAAQEGAEEMDVETVLWESVRQHLIPLNPGAALEKAAAARGLLPASDEVRAQIGAEHWVAQAFRSPTARGTLYLARCREGRWGDIEWSEGRN